MLERRALRLTTEVVLVAAVAAGVAVANLRPLAIVGVMALAWIVVSAAEAAMTRFEPHVGSGSRPAFTVRELRLPRGDSAAPTPAVEPGPRPSHEPMSELVAPAPVVEEAIEAEQEAEPEEPEQPLPAAPAASSIEPEPEPLSEEMYLVIAAELLGRQPVSLTWFDAELPGGVSAGEGA